MKQLTSVEGKLLEGCVWDEKTQKLYFVDIDKMRIYQYNPQSRLYDCMQMPQPVSCIVPEDTATVVAALKDGLYRVDLTHQHYEKIMDDILEPDVRFNDGKCDAYGNLWVGSMSFRAETNKGSLYCIHAEKVVRRYPNYTIPNGLAWNMRHDVLYHIDTPRKTVDQYMVANQYDLLHRSVCLDLAEESGIPDGMCMDAQGNLWIAIWGGGKVVCYNPDTKDKLDELPVPRKNVTCCTIGGSEMNQLFITTAQDETDAGELYVHTLNVKGDIINRYG